jgi:hypothetical protein
MRAAAILNPTPVQHRFIYDNIITWGDAATEHIQIDTAGWFYLNGVKKKLVGMTDPQSYNSGTMYDTANKAIFDTELTYLQSKGVRLYQTALTAWAPASVYAPVLQLLYNHKMLAVPIFTLRGGGTGWDNLTTLDWTVDANGSVSTYLTAWVNAVKAFPNMVAIILENELDNLLAYTYTWAQAASYEAFLVSTARALTTLPFLTKFSFIGNSAFSSPAQNVLLQYSAIPCFDIYNTTANDLSTSCGRTYNWYSRLLNVPSRQFWVTETNYATPYFIGPDATQLTAAMVSAILAQNVSAVFLFSVQQHGTPAAMFFDSSGNYIANLDTLMANMTTWQAPC